MGLIMLSSVEACVQSMISRLFAYNFVWAGKVAEAIKIKN